MIWGEEKSAYKATVQLCMHFFFSFRYLFFSPVLFFGKVLIVPIPNAVTVAF